MDRSQLKALALVAVAAPFLFASSAVAATLLDTFNVDSNALTSSGPQASQVQGITIAGNPATRTLLVSSNGASNAQVQTTGGQFDFASFPSVGGVGSVEYSNFTVNASTTPIMRFTIGSSLGSGVAEIGLTSSTGSGVIANFGTIPGDISSPTAVHFDMRNFANYQPGFLSGIVSIAVAFRGDSGSAYFLKLNDIALISDEEFTLTLPEPTLIGLMLPAALLFSARRKSRTARG